MSDNAMPASLVLVVDDQEQLRNAIGALLRPEGYRLEFAADGFEGLTKAASLLPDLILLDVMMPGMDGFETCSRLRADAALAEVPIVMVTALDDRESRLAGLKAGADDFITKPYDSAELRARVRSITRLNRYRRILAERARFQWVIEGSQDGYVALDGNGAILYANDKARVFLNVPAIVDPRGLDFVEQVRTCFVLEPAGAWNGWPRATDAATRRLLVRPETTTSRAFWLEATVSAARAGVDDNLVVRLRDVTAEVNQSQEIRLFQFLVSHKLRTPLNGLLGTFEFLKEAAGDPPSPEVAEFIAIGEESAHRLMSVADDMTRFFHARTATEGGTPCVVSALPGLAMAIAAEMALAGVTVTVSPEFASGSLALTSESVQLVLSEAFENARKYHPLKEPHVDVTLGPSPGGERVMLRVSDDGISLSPDQLAKAWQPFVQAEKHLTGEIPGLGVGLPMIATVIWGVGGRVTLENRIPGPGVVLSIELPQVASLAT